MKRKLAVLACAACLWPALAGAQTATTCGPKEFPASLVRIYRPDGTQGTGVVIIRRDTHAIVLTAKHVVPGFQNFSVVFQAAPARPIPVQWTQDMLLADPIEIDLLAFRIDAPIPREVRPQDPYLTDVPIGSPMAMWGYPTVSGATLCSQEGPLVARNSGRLTIGAYVPDGVSGGPVFFLDPAGAPKLAGIVVEGTGSAKLGTTNAIDILQAVRIVTTGKDPRNGNLPPIWPNIQLPDELPVDSTLSFRHVKSGAFTMGAGGDSSTRTLPSFYMGKYEVTRGQYHECVTAGACTYTKPNGPPGPGEGNLPVVFVSWYEADLFAKWLQRRLSIRKDVPVDLQRLLNAGWKVDLPSEEEWEKSARKDGKANFPWGDAANQPDANYNTGRPRAVNASKCRDCQWGLFDLAGNVREWTRSLMRPYPYKAAEAEKPTDPGRRAVRGGSFKEYQSVVQARQTVRATNREDVEPDKADGFTGFRVALICKNEGDTPCIWQAPD